MLDCLGDYMCRTVNDLRIISKHASMVKTQVEQVLKAQNDFLNEMNNRNNDHVVRVMTRGGKTSQEPLYLEGHPKRIEQDSQGISTDALVLLVIKRKRIMIGLCMLLVNLLYIDTPENPNDVSISDAETQSGDEHEPSNNVNDDILVDAQPSNDNDVEIEHVVDLDNSQPKNKRYDKRDFVARKHGKEREPWV